MADPQTLPHPSTAADDPILAEIVRRLVPLYQPERIYLFGSAARGEGGPDSDYDIMVLVRDDTPDSLRYTKRVHDVLRGVDASIDVLVWTKRYFDDRLSLKASLPATIVREGRLLYESR